MIAICDVNAERAQNITNQFGVKAYTESKEMLKDEEIEAVSVCTWSTILAKEALKVSRLESMFWLRNPWLPILNKQKIF